MKKIKVCERCGETLKNGEGGSYRRSIYVPDFEKGQRRKLEPFYLCSKCDSDFYHFMKRKA